MRQLITPFILFSIVVNSTAAPVTALIPHNGADLANKIETQQRLVNYYSSRVSQDLASLANAKKTLKSLQKQLKQAQPKQNLTYYWSRYGANKKYMITAAKNQKNLICQAHYFGNIYPGTVSQHGCRITYAGKAYFIGKYKALYATGPVQWVKGNQAPALPNTYYQNRPYMRHWRPEYSIGPVMPSSSTSTQPGKNTEAKQYKPLIGGQEQGHYLYICRANLNSYWQIGKVVSGNTCMISLNDREASIPSYEVLVVGKSK